MTDRKFESLVHRGNETRNFDCKGPMRWDAADVGCAGLIKDILAMANSGGGVIVLGVSEDSSSARGWDWRGVPLADVHSWDQTKLGEVVRIYAGASVELTIDRATIDDKTFVILTIAPFRKHPFVCAKSREKDGEKGDERFLLRRLAIYVRTNEAQTAVLTGADLRSSRPARVSFNKLAESIESGLRQRDDIDLRGCYIDLMFPAVYGAVRFTLPQLEQSMKIGARQVGHSLFVRPPDDPGDAIRGNDSIGWILIWETTLGRNERLEFWQFQTSGLLFSAQRMWEEAVSRKNQMKSYLVPDSVIEHVAGGLDALVGIYSALGVHVEEITWSLRLTGTQGRHIAFPPATPPPPGGFKDADPEPIT
jgi:hypothetical protein